MATTRRGFLQALGLGAAAAAVPVVAVAAEPGVLELGGLLGEFVEAQVMFERLEGRAAEWFLADEEDVLLLLTELRLGPLEDPGALAVRGVRWRGPGLWPARTRPKGRFVMGRGV